MAKRFTIEAVFKMIDKVTAPITRIQNRMQKFTRSMFRGITRVNRVVTKLSSSLKRMGIIAAAAAIPIGFAVGSLITSGAEFGRAIGVAAIIFGGIKRGTDAFKELEGAALKVGATTEFTAIQAANGLKFLSLAGFEAADAVAALPDVVNFATAAQLDLATASDLASDVIKQFGLDSKDADENLAGLNRAMDVMTITASNANTNVSQMFEALKKAGPLARVANASIETVVATLGFLGDNGIKGATAGIAMKNILLSLSGVGNQSAKIFERLQIALSIDGKLRDQFDVLDDLRDKLKGLGEEEQLAIIFGIFGKIPIASASALISSTGDSLRKLRDDALGAKGSIKLFADFIRADVRGSMDAFFSAITNVKLAIFSVNEGGLKDMLDGWTKWIRLNEEMLAQKIGGFFKKIIDNLGTIVTWIKNIAIGLAAFIAFTTVLKTFVLVMTAVNLVMALSGPGLLVVGILAAVAAFTALVIWVDEVDDMFSKLPIALRLVLIPLEAIVAAIKVIKGVSGFGIDVAVAAGKKTAELVAPVTDTIFAANDFIAGKLGSFFSSTVSDLQGALGLTSESAPTPQVISPRDRTVNTSSEILVRGENTILDVIKNGMGANLVVESSGTFE